MVYQMKLINCLSVESGVSLLHVDQGAKDQRHVEKDLKTKGQ